MMCFEKKEMTWTADKHSAERNFSVKFIIVKFLAVIVVLCTGMLNGCSVWDEDVEDLSSHKLIGYSGDSLVVYIEEKAEETCLAKPLGDDCSTREKGTRIMVDNFYTQENVWKSSKIRDKYITNIYDLVDDSTIVEYDKSDASFYRWTLGDGYEKLGTFTWSGCDMKNDVSAIRNWGEGKWRLIGGNESCAYAIVDVENKKVTGYEKKEDFAVGCSDVWDHDGVKYCVGTFEKDTVISYYERYQDGVYLMSEENVDSLWSYEIKDGINALNPIIEHLNSFIWINVSYHTSALLKIDYKSSKIDTSISPIWLDGYYWSGLK